ncbi:hypothetical protein J437_LFUL011665 [Ladona fulva]|uniref:Uncharacterized protein n=1 Tax=Ladona fulva TaxID=123851 RepID=A0A8K0KFZ0_LADFU|nr:hypothetical protein J437_LFUL011665 [Ladona fulva]
MEAHNEYRAKHQAPPLKLNDEVTSLRLSGRTPRSWELAGRSVRIIRSTSWPITVLQEITLEDTLRTSCHQSVD